jgi:uncharacterized membrane protein YgcG
VDYENSSNTNAYTTASLMFGAGIGARFALSKHVSLDFRYEMMQGTETLLVDLDRSVFNSLSSFQLSKFTVSPEYQQLKFGVLFDLWDGEETREYKPENNNEVVEVSEYYYFDSTTNQYLKVYCRCSETPVVNDSNDTKNNTFITPPDHYEISKPGSTPNRNKEFPINNSRSGNSGGSGGGGKGSFPGIKSGGGGGIKIKS